MLLVVLQVSEKGLTAELGVFCVGLLRFMTVLSP